MHKFKSEQEIRDHVALLKNFYGEVTSYLFLNAAFIILWVLAGGGYFWPIWPIVIWLASLIIKASKLNIIDETIYQQCDAFREKLPFMKAEWTEQKVQELLVYLKAKPAASPAPSAASAGADKRPAASKPVARKPAPKRSPVKRSPPRKK